MKLSTKKYKMFYSHHKSRFSSCLFFKSDTLHSIQKNKCSFIQKTAIVCDLCNFIILKIVEVCLIGSKMFILWKTTQKKLLSENINLLFLFPHHVLNTQCKAGKHDRWSNKIFFSFKTWMKISFISQISQFLSNIIKSLSK